MAVFAELFQEMLQSRFGNALLAALPLAADALKDGKNGGGGTAKVSDKAAEGKGSSIPVIASRSSMGGAGSTPAPPEAASGDAIPMSGGGAALKRATSSGGGVEGSGGDRDGRVDADDGKPRDSKRARVDSEAPTSVPAALPSAGTAEGGLVAEEEVKLELGDTLSACCRYDCTCTIHTLHLYNSHVRLLTLNHDFLSLDLSSWPEQIL